MKSSRSVLQATAFACLLCIGVHFSRPASAQSRQPADLFITAKHIVTMDASRRVLDDGAIAVRAGKIVAIGPRTEIEAKYTPARTLDARDKLVMPGLINGHTHAAMSLLRGIADDMTLQDWLQKFIFPAEARNVTEDFVTWGTRLGVIEMLKGGTTTYADMYYFEDAVARETKAAGMRGILGETFIDFPAPDNKTMAQTLSYTEEFLKHWRGDPLIHAAPAPHSMYLCSEKTLKDAAALARKYQAPILIHVSETKKEIDDSRAAHDGESPVAYLNRLGFLGPDVIAAHCVWVDADDIALLAKSRTGCVHNPSSNMMLASGVAPVVQMLNAGLAVGLGTDGPAGSNNDLDMMEEMDLAAKLQKVSRKDPQALGAQQAVEMATIRGAQAMHMENEIGSLEAGKDADLIVLNLDAPNAVPLYNLYSQIVYALKASDVEDVVINGRVVMLNRHVLTLNEPEIVARAREIAARVKQSLQRP
ncbi:MAG TPA: amidohydrolase [Candidatus Acidoferrales bacterium]|nr:amidohydrolase [Candidatus Acidoferrales bacterium]